MAPKKQPSKAKGGKKARQHKKAKATPLTRRSSFVAMPMELLRRISTIGARLSVADDAPHDEEDALDDDDAPCASLLEDSIKMIRQKSKTWLGTTYVTDDQFEARFALREILGEGSFGTVHRVLRLSDGMELASKTISNTGTAAHWAEAHEEAKSWARVSSPFHPSILPLLEVLEVEGSALHLITEMMPCAELGDAIFNVAMSEQACRLIMVQITSAVAHLHLRYHLAHRDVKPDNVLCLSEDPTRIGCLKLCDFGLCHAFSSARAAEFRQPCGTCDYFAPELARGFQSCLESPKTAAELGELGLGYSAMVDVWALGCVLYEMLHGYPPHTAPSKSEADVVRDAAAQSELPLPDGTFSAVSAVGIDFLRRLLEPNPERRLAVEEVLAHPWLQPVQDESLRVQMAAELPTAAHERRAVFLERRREGSDLTSRRSTRGKAVEKAGVRASLARAPSTVKSTRNVLARLSTVGGRLVHAAPPAAEEGDDDEELEVDPMLHYRTVYFDDAKPAAEELEA